MSGSSSERAVARLAAWIGLAGLDGVGSAALWELFATDDVEREWERRSSAQQRASAEAAALAHQRRGVRWTEHGDPGHPSIEVGDPHVPPMLFRLGDRPIVEAAGGITRPPTVGIVGTRRASRAGLEIAHELGAACAAAGVSVVSGLAAGIDAAAHRGALGTGVAPPIAVVGTGLDVVYPSRNAELWREVARHGEIVSEYPLGTRPAPWRFPARNRILVGMSDVVVVVESSERGGSLITASLAGERGVPVLAVPGSVRSPTSRGTNRLLADGCAPCLGPEDVLVALGLDGTPTLPFDARTADPDRPGGSADSSVGLDPLAREVLEAVGWEPTSIEAVASVLPQRSLGDLLGAVQDLLRRGHLADRGGCLERVR